MAINRAVITRVTPFSEDAHWLELKLISDESLDFVGGQYIIVNTGLFEDGRAIKRAYSIASADTSQATFSLAVRRIGEGPASNHLLSCSVGDELPFSGPWGKFLPLDSAMREHLWVVATDTGITAALGLVSGRSFTPQLPKTRLLWLKSHKDDSIPVDAVRERLPDGLRRFEFATISPIGEAKRLNEAWAKVTDQQVLPSHAFLVGDGLIVVSLRDRLIEQGMRPESISTETFFNHPVRKSDGRGS
jgi:ferredoxin-NADP reductase